MKVKELFNSPDRWTKRAYALKSNGKLANITSNGRRSILIYDINKWDQYADL